MAAITKSLQSCIFASRFIAYRGCIQSPPALLKFQHLVHDVASNEPTYQHKELTEGEKILSDELAASPGPERWELISRVKGIEDPFDLTAKKVTAGTKDKPTVISTICHERTVGCICKDDSVVIKWMKLELGETKKCECGHWFKLVTLAE